MLVALALGAAFTALFAFAASMLMRYVPWATFVGFWPVVFAAAGITALVVPSTRHSFAARACIMLLGIELCIGFLPFTLGVCPPFALQRIGLLPWVLIIASAVCLVLATGLGRIEFLAASVVLFALGLGLSWIDLGTVDRFLIMRANLHKTFLLSQLR